MALRMKKDERIVKMNKPSSVRAAVCYGPGKVGVETFPYPEVPEGGAIMKSIQSGICGTDKHTYNGLTKQFAGTKFEFDVPFPIIQGHEGVGIIEEISKEGAKTLEFNGEELRPGDRVTFGPVRTCKKCYYCKHMAWYNLCEGKERINYGNSISSDVPPHLFGAFGEYMTFLKGSNLFKLPDEIDDDMACFVEPMAVTYTLDQAMSFSSFGGEGWSFGCNVVVQGCGPIGIAHIIKARMLGANKIIVTDISDYRLQLAKEFGADICINSNKTTAEERIEIVLENTHGLGADIGVQCVGIPEVVPEGLEMMRKAGMYIDPGSFADVGASQINMHRVCSKSLRIFGASEHAITGFRPSIEMMIRHKNDFPWHKLFSHRYNIDDYDEAMKVSNTLESMKVLVSPWNYKK